jgi:hypothetical protein
MKLGLEQIEPSKVHVDQESLQAARLTRLVVEVDGQECLFAGTVEHGSPCRLHAASFLSPDSPTSAL